MSRSVANNNARPTPRRRCAFPYADRAKKSARRRVIAGKPGQLVLSNSDETRNRQPRERRFRFTRPPVAEMLRNPSAHKPFLGGKRAAHLEIAPRARSGIRSRQSVKLNE